MIRRTSRRHWAAAAAVVACLLPLSACGGSASKDAPAVGTAGSVSDAASAGSGTKQLSIPANADADTKNTYLEENAIAACMAQRGFSYTPFVPDYATAENDPVDGQDYALAKTYRQKYGYGFYASVVYPNDTNTPGDQTAPSNPNTAYANALPSAQRTAYDTALGAEGAYEKDGKKHEVIHKDGCSEQSRLKVYGPQKTQAQLDQEGAQDDERARENQQALDGDPQLVALAQGYASCLRSDGIPVTTTQPTSIGDMVKFQVSGSIPDNELAHMTKDEALPKLTREIDIAVQDLNCGKDFRAAYFPKLKAHPFAGATG